MKYKILNENYLYKYIEITLNKEINKKEIRKNIIKAKDFYNLENLKFKIIKDVNENKSFGINLKIGEYTKMINLNLNLKKEYFEEIKKGRKTFEYRLCTPYWQKRLLNRNYDKIIIKLGYPKKDDLEKQMFFQWNGYVIRSIKHKEFGDCLVNVFCINLDKRIS